MVILLDVIAFGLGVATEQCQSRATITLDAAKEYDYNVYDSDIAMGYDIGALLLLTSLFLPVLHNSRSVLPASHSFGRCMASYTPEPVFLHRRPFLFFPVSCLRRVYARRRSVSCLSSPYPSGCTRPKPMVLPP